MTGAFTATGSGEKKQVLPGRKEFIIDVSPAIEPGQWPECCIYRVPELLRRVEKEAYTPKLVHIGPLHYSMQQPKDIEIQKLRYLKEFCERTKKSQNDLAGIIQSDELKIRHCYSETFDQINSEEFVKMILLDAIFIIEFILRSQNAVGSYKDHILSKPCLAHYIEHDLILLENQLPYFVLKKLYNFALDVEKNQQGKAPDPFLKLACNFLLQKPDAVTEENEVKHLTDLLRTYYNLPHLSSKSFESADRFYQVCSATKLDEVGVKFKLAPATSGLLDIKFKKKYKYLDWCPCLTFTWLLACLPWLKCFACLELMQPLFEMPRLVIDDVTEGIFRNIMALEQCHYPMEAHFCNYVILLDYIINDEKDIELLVEKKIIVNMLGSHTAAAAFFNKLCLQIVTNGRSCYAEVIKGLRTHYDDHWSRIMATMARVYFGDFWRGAATVIGLILLVNSLWGLLQPFVMKK
ncbi:UPF0481 protein At3g47200-like [Juglans microcarpa x Juglans regia]|uniref:UPF0481 protein At3g47200-like n=1 Tax=Juglans microcarpa x Juglans regia TaxID=2249226 RepID=UPI001B7DC3EB|nr:UPF0481 protein At3g47200-like [Juglans microcarpa x Juglans regia]